MLLDINALCRSIPLILTMAASAALAGCEDRNTYQAPPPAEVGVLRPDARKITIYREFTGTTKASKQVDLMARVQGFLHQISYTDGEKVKADRVLFRIERAPYETSLAIGEAAVAQQEALLVQAEAELARQSELKERQVTAAARFEDARAKRDSAAAALAQAKGQVDQARINLGYTEVKAPFDGIVSARLADQGALVGTGGATKLATIYQISPIYVSFNISESQALLARRRLSAQGLTIRDIEPIPVEIGLQGETGFPHTGRIDYVSPDLDAATGTLGVRSVLENTSAALMPGLFVRVRVPAQRDVEAMLVPDAALGNDQQGRYLLVVNKDDIVLQQRVEVGDLADGGQRVITAGLKGDERIIVTGLQRATPGATVRPVEVRIAAPQQKQARP